MKFEVGASEEFFDSRLQRKKPTMRKWEKLKRDTGQV